MKLNKQLFLVAHLIWKVPLFFCYLFKLLLLLNLYFLNMPVLDSIGMEIKKGVLLKENEKASGKFLSSFYLLLN